jgi:hypothetical protein
MIPRGNPCVRSGCGREGSNPTKQNISSRRKKDNRQAKPLEFYERFLLCRLMTSAKPVKYDHFVDHRNRLIYAHLAYLQTQEYAPGVNSLIRYLRECGALNRAGGEAYLQSIFRGIPEEASRE